ncbi:unannotated protein [freshwater metagenome]|uniref:Unannotated protein n=1 Tax=freshwater metagenome TaxID=449393 RepID=A0A6J7KA92_9ZZZZ|nr:DUF3048 domain-containing protein [Actinomycetota bacterium]
MNNRIVVRSSIVAVSLLALANCGGSSSSTDGTAAESTVVTETTNAVVVNPLTGLPNTDSATLNRPAMVVKIDNHPSARPQLGINQADIIFEENVEKLTRLAAVFQSEGSDPVGPIRSGRFQDIDLLGSLMKPLFVWSGGNAQVAAAIKKSDLVDLSYSVANKAGGFHRDNDRSAPHNLFAETTKLWTLSPEGSAAPSAQFSYRSASDAAATTAQPIAGLKVSMDGVKVQWDWDATTSEFLRIQEKTPDVDAAGVQLAVPNVIVLEVEYTKGYSPTSKTLGSGKVYVFTNGTLIEGTWERTDRLTPFVLKDSSGAVIKLTPGQTFVEVARAAKTAVVPVGTNPDDVKFL